MKHIILATLAMALSSVAMADNVKQIVKGTCPADAKKIYVFYNAESRTPADSIQVVNGQFQTTLCQEKNTYVSLTLDDTSIPFFADGTPVTVDFTNCTSTGSDINNQLGVVTNKLCDINKRLSVILSEYYPLYREENSTDADIKRVDELEPQILELSSKADSIVMEVFKSNKTTLLGAAYISDMMYGLDYAELKDILAADNELTRHPMAEPARRFLASMAKRAPGTQYTDVTENDVDGKAHKLSEWVGKGNYVMIDFWASWCGPCRAEMPNVAANYARYHSKGFEVIGISLDSKLDQWKKAISKINMPWIHLSDLKGWNNIAASTYDIKSVPSSILIDPNGKIIAIDLKGEKLTKKLREIYGF